MIFRCQLFIFIFSLKHILFGYKNQKFIKYPELIHSQVLNFLLNGQKISNNIHNIIKIKRAYFKFTAIEQKYIIISYAHSTKSMSITANATPYSYPDPATLYNLSQFSSIDAKTLDFILYQIKNYVKQLLQSVTIIYKTYHIVFPVYQYFDGILRMVSPVELNALININYIKCMFEQRIEIGKPNSNQNQDQKNKAHNVNLMSNISLDDDQQPKDQITKRNQGKEQLIVHSKKSPYKTKLQGTVRRPLRSRGLQDQILMWMTSQFQKGKVLTKPQIMMKGRQLGKPLSFKACPRWCNNFLKRNPQIKREMKKRLNFQGTYIRWYDQEQIARAEYDGYAPKKQKSQQQYKLSAEQIHEDQSLKVGFNQIGQIQQSKENERSQIEESEKMEEFDDEEVL